MVGDVEFVIFIIEIQSRYNQQPQNIILFNYLLQ